MIWPTVANGELVIPSDRKAGRRARSSGAFGSSANRGLSFFGTAKIVTRKCQTGDDAMILCTVGH